VSPNYQHIHQEVIRQCKRGDRSAQRQLYNMYAGPMLTVSLRIVNNRAEAEDVLQDAFLDMFTRLETLREASVFAAWFKRIVINRSINQVKKRRVHTEVADDLHGLPEELEEAPKMDYSMADIQRATEQLADGYRMVFTLYLFEGMSHKEIAEQLGISEATSKSQLNRSKKKVRDLLKQWNT